MRLLIVLLSAACSVPPTGTAEAQVTGPLRAYFIGNSLTLDARLEGVAAMGGVEVGWHIRGARGLNYMETTPGNVSSVQPSSWPTALMSGDWDCLILQPYDVAGVTLLQELDAAADLIAYAVAYQPNVRVFLYMTWPAQGPDYAADWLTAVPNDLDAAIPRRRGTFENLRARLAVRTNRRIDLVPVGEVLLEIDRGALVATGVTSPWSMYFDAIHLRREDGGEYMAGVTTWASITGDDPRGEPRPPVWYGGPTVISAELELAIQETAYSVLELRR